MKVFAVARRLRMCVGDKDLADPVRREVRPGSECAEGQSLKTPITPLLCTLAILYSLSGGSAHAQTSANPDAAQLESTYSTGALNK